MELVIAIVIIGVGLVWYYNNKSRSSAPSTEQDQSHLAPYKIETPAVVPEPVTEVPPAPATVAKADVSANWPFPTTVAEAVVQTPKAQKPAAKKAPAKKKPVAAKPSAMTAAKKPRAKKPATK